MRSFAAWSNLIIRKGDKKSDDPVQGAPFLPESIHPFFDHGIFFKNGSVVRFDACINNERAPAPPVLIFNKTINAINIGGGIAARESGPEKIVNVRCQELTVVTKDDEGEGG